MNKLFPPQSYSPPEIGDIWRLGHETEARLGFTDRLLIVDESDTKTQRIWPLGQPQTCWLCLNFDSQTKSWYIWSDFEPYCLEVAAD